MDFSLTETQQTLRSDIAAYAREHCNIGVAERDRDQTFARDLWQIAGEKLRLPGLHIASEYGGGGHDPITTVLGMEAFGHACEDAGFVFAMGAHMFACLSPITKFATDAQRQKYLPGLCDGSQVAANCMTEPDAGSDIAAIATTATPTDGGYLLNGIKTLGTNGPVADIALIFAVTDDSAGLQSRLTCFLVDTKTPGFQIKERFESLGHRTAPIGDIVLKDVFAPADTLLGDRPGIGAAVFQHAMTWERVGLFASHVGAMDRILENTIKFARRRHQSGQAISKFQAVSHKIVDMKVRVEASRSLVYRAACRLDKARDVALDACIAKLFTSESLVQTAQDALQIRGGQGYLADSEAARDLRDAIGTTLYSGTSEIQRNMIAAWLGL